MTETIFSHPSNERDVFMNVASSVLPKGKQRASVPRADGIEDDDLVVADELLHQR